uniref:Uncharacterized protein n=1 Tax=Panagrolaimus sp. ES5 TaxID=591445 RepID=A0AC34GU75_9BILA
MDCKCVRAKYKFQIADVGDYQFITEMINTSEYGTGKLKGAIFDLFEIKPVKIRYEFCNLWKTYCDIETIPYQFINSSTLLISSILFGAHVNRIDQNSVTIIHVTKEEILIIHLEPNSDGYILKKMNSLDLNCTDELLKNTVTKNNEFSRTILSLDDPSNARPFRSILKPQKHVKSCSSFICNSLLALINDVLGIRRNKVKLLPYFETDLFISKHQNYGKFYGSFEIKCLKMTQLPFYETVDVFVMADEIIEVNYWNGEVYENMETQYLSEFLNSRTRIILSIDENNFCDIEINKLKNSEVFIFQKRQPDVFIGLDEDEIHISTPKLFKLKDPYINFLYNDRPVIGEDAKKLLVNHASYIVYDILKITKMSTASNIQINPKWGFKVEKDSNDVLQIIFNTWRGKRKATPHFLIAILINFLMKYATECIGFRPKAVDIQIGDNFNDLKKEVIAALKIVDSEYDIKCLEEERDIQVDIVYLDVLNRIISENEKAIRIKKIEEIQRLTGFGNNFLLDFYNSFSLKNLEI